MFSLPLLHAQLPKELQAQRSPEPPQPPGLQPLLPPFPASGVPRAASPGLVTSTACSQGWVAGRGAPLHVRAPPPTGWGWTGTPGIVWHVRSRGGHWMPPQVWSRAPARVDRQERSWPRLRAGPEGRHGACAPGGTGCFPAGMWAQCAHIFQFIKRIFCEMS